MGSMNQHFLFSLKTILNHKNRGIYLFERYQFRTYVNFYTTRIKKSERKEYNIVVDCDQSST